MKNIIIFDTSPAGVELYYKLRVTEHVMGFIDNDTAKHGKQIVNATIFPPDWIKGRQYDAIYVADSLRFKEICSQLMELGAEREKIIPPAFNKVLTQNIYEYLSGMTSGESFSELEEQWQKLKNQYNRISVYQLRVGAIGELIARVIPLMLEKNREDELCVFVPLSEDNGRICNRVLVDMTGRYLYTVNAENARLWLYILQEHPDEVNLEDYRKYFLRHDLTMHVISDVEPCMSFGEEQIVHGNHLLQEAGIHGKYVCLYARTENYNRQTMGDPKRAERIEDNYKFRNMDFGVYQPVIRKLRQNNLLSVRVGSEEPPISPIENCIDYAGCHRNEFMDLFVISRCEFLIANVSGLVQVAALFGKPCLLINCVGLTFGYGGIPYTANDLYIPKKVYDKKRERYLTLREIADLESDKFIFGGRYAKAGIEFVNNTEEEILSAVDEMLARLNGNWQDTEEDLAALQKYDETITKLHCQSLANPGNWIGGCINYRIAVSYLRHNMYLLD